MLKIDDGNVAVRGLGHLTDVTTQKKNAKKSPN